MVQIMLKEANVKENNIQYPPLEEKAIEKKFQVQQKVNCGQIKRVMVSNRDKESQLPIHLNMYMGNCILINGNPLIYYLIIKHLKLSRSAHPMVERFILDFCYCVKNGIEYKGVRKYNQWDHQKLL